MQELKNVPAIRECSYILKKNLKAVAYGGKLSKMPYAIDEVAAIYYSKWRGGIVLNDKAISTCFTLKSKKNIEAIYMAKLKKRC
jgi:hypothetical protein